MKHTRILIILIVLFIIYKISSKENFALDVATYFTDKSTFAAGQANANTLFYKGTLKTGVTNTVTPSKYGGTNCNNFPVNVYQKLPSTNSTCNLGTGNINAYTMIPDSDTACVLDAPTGKYFKTLNKIADATAFNNATTVAGAYGNVGPVNGGSDCFSQNSSLATTIKVQCTPINAVCSGDGTSNNIIGNYTVDTTTAKAGSLW